MHPQRCAAFAALVLLGTPSLAATLHITGLTPALNARITVQCEANRCSGPAAIELIDAQGRLQQTLDSEDFVFDLRGHPTANGAYLLKATEQTELIAQDFNFDGSIDLAIRNGTDESSSSPLHDVYVYQAGRRRFVLSEDLTALASAGQGMFTVDTQRKRLGVLEKSGCCWHKTTEYGIRAGQGLYETGSREEAVEVNGNWVKVTTTRLVGSKKVTTVRRYKVKDYDKGS